ncbi:phospholipid/cholesterol/gamma-HCH transport system substrate-binding protein [Marmoricola sp. OAE513]|uniref:MCE family protein n=1 Tax=Marmoricola sp. OAE513 TaxID=2817894 RepID=UPI001AEA912E
MSAEKGTLDRAVDWLTSTGARLARDPFKIGVAALVVGALVAAMVVVTTFVTVGKKSYTAVLEQTAGLRVGEDVEVHGVPVGSVRSIELDGDKVRVGFVMDGDIELGDESTAAVKVATLLGTHYLAVDPQGSGTIGTIPLSRTSVPFNLQDVLEKGTQNLDKLDPVLLAKALTETSKTLTASSQNIGPALTGIARLSEAVEKRSGQTSSLLTAARSVTDQLSDSSADIVTLMQQSNLVIGEITSRRKAIHTLLVQTTTLASSLDQIIERTKGDMAPALRQLNEVLATLRAQDKTLKGVLDTMAPTVRYLANATGNGPWGDLWLKDPALPPDDLSCKLGGC